jgi:ABC-type multidrug transport system fused ATPase/permease subunit
LKKHILYKAYSLLTPVQRKKGLGITFLLFVSSVLDFFSLILLMVGQESLQTNRFAGRILAIPGLTSTVNIGVALTLIVLLFIVVKTRINLWITHRKARYAFGVGSELASLAVTRYLKLSYAEFTHIDYSKELNRISNLPLNFANNIIIPAGTLLSETLVFSMLCIGMAVYKFNVFVSFLLIMIPALFVYRNSRANVSAISIKIGTTYPLLLKYTLQMIEGLIDIRSFQKESFFKKRFTTVSNQLSSIFAVDHTAHTGTARTTELLAAVCICGLLLYSLVSHQNQQDTLILLTVYAGASFRIIPSVNRIFGALHQIKSNQHVVDDLGQIVVLEGDSFDHKYLALEFKDSVELRTISFGYPGQPLLLQRANWKIRKGEKVALTGKSGNGKTSLLLLLMRLLVEKEGELFLDGRKLTEPDIPAWRKLFGYVPQVPYVLDSSIADNIAFGVPPDHVDADRIRQLLADMDLMDWIAGLPEGADTLIGEKGATISGGQRQRLAIARAMYHEAEILLLDEVTNQLDPKTESEIFESLRRASANKTIIMITHHPDLLRKFDRVFEILEGEIREVAKHQFHAVE